MFLRIALSAVIVCPLFAQGVKIAYDPVSADVVTARLKLNPSSNGDRAAALRKLFEEAGCTGAKLSDQAVAGAKQPNVICTFGGAGSTIVVGAHFDTPEIGSGVVENWSGASLLPSLYQSLQGAQRKHKFVLIGFTDRERGRRGSAFYVKSLGGEQAKVKAMIDIEKLGLTPTKIQMQGCDKGLSVKLAGIAKAVNLPVTGADNLAVGESDARSFQSANIPVISIHSVAGDARKIPGTKADLFMAIHMTEYYDSYRLIAAYLAYLDETLD